MYGVNDIIATLSKLTLTQCRTDKSWKNELLNQVTV